MAMIKYSSKVEKNSKKKSYRISLGISIFHHSSDNLTCINLVKLQK